MDHEMKETVLQAVDYTNTEAERYQKRVRICNAIAMLLIAAYTIIKDTSLYAYPAVVNAMEFAQGAALGMLLVGIIYSSRYGARVRAFKQRLLKRQG